MAQHSVRRGEGWDISFWLVFNNLGNIRLTRGEPLLDRNERAMQMQLKLPHALFKVPMLKASMTIEAQDPVVPPIDLTAAAESLKQAMGCDIDVRIVEPDSA